MRRESGELWASLDLRLSRSVASHTRSTRADIFNVIFIIDFVNKYVNTLVYTYVVNSKSQSCGRNNYIIGQHCVCPSGEYWQRPYDCIALRDDSIIATNYWVNGEINKVNININPPLSVEWPVW